MIPYYEMGHYGYYAMPYWERNEDPVTQISV